MHPHIRALRLTALLAALAIVGGAEESRASEEETERLPADLVELATTFVLEGGFTELDPCPRDNELSDEYVEFVEQQLASVAPTSREAVRSLMLSRCLGRSGREVDAIRTGTEQLCTAAWEQCETSPCSVTLSCFDALRAHGSDIGRDRALAVLAATEGLCRNIRPDCLPRCGLSLGWGPNRPPDPCSASEEARRCTDAVHYLGGLRTYDPDVAHALWELGLRASGPAPDRPPETGEECEESSACPGGTVCREGWCVRALCEEDWGPYRRCIAGEEACVPPGVIEWMSTGEIDPDGPEHPAWCVALEHIQ